MFEDVTHYYLSKKEPNKSCLLALKSIILAQDTLITETLKWNIPCFSYQKKIFCYLNMDKKIDKPYILIVEGKHLSHTELEQGNRTRMKILRIQPDADLPINTIQKILNDALDLYRNGIIPVK